MGVGNASEPVWGDALAPKEPLNLRGWDTFTLRALQDSTSGNSGAMTAAAFVVDAAGHHFIGDAYPLITRWQAVPVDLADAAAAGVALDQIVALGAEFRSTRPAEAAPPTLTVDTDTWTLESTYRAYVGQRFGVPGTFYVQRAGPALYIGRVNRFEVVFRQRGMTLPDLAAAATAPSGSAAWSPMPRAWLEITQGPHGRQVLGQPGTGLMLIDQDQLDALSAAFSQRPLETGAQGRAVGSAGNGRRRIIPGLPG